MSSVLELGKMDRCSGCSACINICPKNCVSFEKTKKGFLYPTINNDNCVHCNSCSNNCPWLIDKTIKISERTFYSAKRTNFKKRMISQSGGAFSVFAEYVLKQKGIVYGVEYNGSEAIYCRVNSIKKLKRIRGSKYVQARVGTIFKEVEKDLINNKVVLFSGTGCHIDGLKKYLEFKNIDCLNLITVDIICHGVVSPQILADYLTYLSKYHGRKIKHFNFRDKTFGWHGHITSYKAGPVYYKNKDYVKIFYSSYALRESCFKCRYADLMRIGDISIGDSWGIGDYYPDFDDNKGCSLIVINTKVGSKLFEETKKHFDFIEINKSEALQPNLEHPTEKPSNYDNFWNDYFKFGFEYAVYKYCDFQPTNAKVVLKKYQIFRRLSAKVRRIFGL